MSKLRSLNTAFWSDTWVEELEPMQKLLFIYLVTNEKTNMLGIYEASVKKISFETGITQIVVKTYLKDFEKANKVKYIDNRVILINYMKHQNYNTNMKKSAIDTYNNLPNSLKIKGLVISKVNPSEGFERLSKGYGMVPKVEVEVEYETKLNINTNLNSNGLVKEAKPDYSNHIKFKDLTVKDKLYLESIAMNKKTNIKTVSFYLANFNAHLISERKIKDNLKEYQIHYKRWLNLQKVETIKEQTRNLYKDLDKDL